MNRVKIFEQSRQALIYAEMAHAEQKIKGSNIPYFFHVSAVFSNLIIGLENTSDDIELALTVAALHDVVEDTDRTIGEIEELFGLSVSNGIAALTKNRNLKKSQQTMDSIQRIKTQSKEIWAVKLADRIVNLSEPPASWSKEKISVYFETSKLIRVELEGCFPILEKKLKDKIETYKKWL